MLISTKAGMGCCCRRCRCRCRPLAPLERDWLKHPPQFWWFRVGGIHAFSFKTSKHCRNLKVIVSEIPSVYTLGTKVKEYTAVLQGIPAYPAGEHDYQVKVRVTSQPSPILTHIKGPEQLHANLGVIPEWNIRVQWITRILWLTLLLGQTNHQEMAHVFFSGYRLPRCFLHFHQHQQLGLFRYVGTSR